MYYYNIAMAMGQAQSMVVYILYLFVFGLYYVYSFMYMILRTRNLMMMMMMMMMIGYLFIMKHVKVVVIQYYLKNINIKQLFMKSDLMVKNSIFMMNIVKHYGNYWKASENMFVKNI